MASQLTVTAKTGPDRQNTALVLPNVTSLNFDLDERVLMVFHKDTNGTPQDKEYDLSSVTTVTFSISGANYTVTVS
ncbi:MAG: hypothetical protein ACREBU_09325 [Nitrososphaera sp.]